MLAQMSNHEAENIIERAEKVVRRDIDPAELK